MKETIATSFFQKYFSDDVEMQNKLSQLPTNYKYIIYTYLKENKRNDEVLNILYNEPIARIRQYFYPDTSTIIELRELKLDFPDDVKETIATSFFQKYFSDDAEMQNKLSQLPTNYRYIIYKYLK